MNYNEFIQGPHESWSNRGLKVALKNIHLVATSLSSLRCHRLNSFGADRSCVLLFFSLASNNDILGFVHYFGKIVALCNVPASGRSHPLVIGEKLGRALSNKESVMWMS